MVHQQLALRLPDWIEGFLAKQGSGVTSREDRMQLAIDLSRLNIEHKTGGPFGAAIFERDSGRLITVGVNLVESANCSLAHAETTAIAMAQQQLGHYDLGAEGLPACELVTSTEPCAMCLGAIGWSGLKSVVCAARGEDAEEIGFDEGAKPADWVGSLRQRRIEVARDVLRDQARAILLQYKQTNGLIYNPHQKP